jgi:hypothetical protein
MSQAPHKQTMNIAKALTYLKLAQEYFDHIYKSKDVSHSPKQVIKGIIGRINGSFNDIKFRLGIESIELLNSELNSDLFVFESIFEKMLHLNEKERWQVEEYLDKLIEKKRKELKS